MKRTIHWATAFAVAASVTALAQQPSSSPAAGATSQSGQKITVQGCLQAGTGAEGMTAAPNSRGTMAAPGAGTTGSPAAGTQSTGSSSSTSDKAGTQGATAQTGQAAGAGRAAAGAASRMFTLRVTDGSGESRTGMPSSTAGQTDERSAAGQRGAKVYHLMSEGTTDLAAHVGHQVEVTGTLSASAHSSMSGGRGGTATTGTGAAGAGSGSSGYTGQATSGSGATGAGAAGGTSTTGTTNPSSQAGSSTSAMGSMGEHGKAAGMIRVTDLKMIASTCR